MSPSRVAVFPTEQARQLRQRRAMADDLHVLEAGEDVAIARQENRTSASGRKRPRQRCGNGGQSADLNEVIDFGSREENSGRHLLHRPHPEALNAAVRNVFRANFRQVQKHSAECRCQRHSEQRLACRLIQQRSKDRGGVDRTPPSHSSDTP